ncbi:PTS sugar transporter subunit IIA [Lactococcus termiticola]|uniref:PTS sugar transporter subunit IIA n=1 Tax=Lactococcus termiticola TaxID=2169526 RepID=A0A2R5HE74_9LACT|nr:PTS acetylgalactosamine transporter subunit IIA [Lactococcus termiticola]GBG96319.1 PTS sugar transporter subunit IIA [Lactococcus termiticola]
MMRALITGHAEFAQGMKSALELIAGPQEEIRALPFDESTGLEAYHQAICDFCDEDEDEEAVIFTDMIGGTPFNQAMIAKEGRQRLHIITGTNLPMLMEFIAQGMIQESCPDCLEIPIETAKEGITLDLELFLRLEEEGGGI